MIKELDFIAIDFETANPDYSSICQIGLVFFENGEIVKEVSQLINPHTHFSGYNINIHGITADMVEGEPTFPEYFQQLHDYIDNKVVISGTFEKWPDRIELAKELKSLGADINSSITGKTNYLITGEGAGPSKLKKMQKNIDEGKDAIIINEFILSVMLGRQS